MSKLTISRLELKEALKPFLYFSKANNVLPVLDYALITVGEAGKGTIRATNLYYDIEIDLNFVQYVLGYQCLVPIRATYNLIMGAEDIYLQITPSTTKGFLNISSGDVSIKLASMNVDDMIKSSIPSAVKGYIMPASKLIENLKHAEKFTSKDELRPSMCGIYLCQWNNKVYMVSTDAHRLLFRKINNMDYCGYDFLIKKDLGRILSSVFKKEQPLVLCRKDKINLIEGESARVAVRNIDEKYPEWSAVLPMDDSNEVFVNRKRLESILKFTSAITDNQHHLKMDIGIDSIILSTEDIFGVTPVSSKSKIQVLKTNQEKKCTIGVDSIFLMTCISINKDDLVKITHSGLPNRAVVINNEVLLMPVMLNNNY